MKAKYGKYASWLAFVDMIFNLLLAFTFLFLMSFLMIHPPKAEQAGIKLSAEFVIEMTWPDDSIDDVDLWMMMPNGKKVNYHTKDVEHITLDRDDRGAMGDITYEDGKPKLLQLNKEMMTIRALVPGKYVVASHMYSTFNNVSGFTARTTLPFLVKVKMTRMNPRVMEVAKTEFMMLKVGDRKTAFSFVLDAEGKISELTYEPDDQIIDDFPGLMGFDSSPTESTR